MAAIDELVERIEALEKEAQVHAELRQRWFSTVNELNNLVAAMKGHSQLVDLQPDDHHVQELVRVVQTSTSRIQERIRSSMQDIDPQMVSTTDREDAEEACEVDILVVDDEKLIRSLLYELLVKSGYRVAVAGSGSEAVNECKDKLFDLIFMDYRLGDMDGIQALRKIREYQTECRVVFLTGDPAIEEIQAAVFKEGADGFITKPFDLKQITDVVHHIVQTKKA